MCKIEVRHEGDAQKIEISRIRAEVGRKGGLARVPKGFAKMNPERRREIAIKASQKAALLRSAKAKKEA
jgi:hypothetical protein